ncbi:MAG: hypothetical protein H0W58_18095 [Acidobacteria bacterium]|nr:hypothetical protein [Acidobacteriota bacterium]
MSGVWLATTSPESNAQIVESVNNDNNLLTRLPCVKCVSSSLKPRVFKHPNRVSICHRSPYSNNIRPLRSEEMTITLSPSTFREAAAKTF